MAWWNMLVPDDTGITTSQGAISFDLVPVLAFPAGTPQCLARVIGNMGSIGGPVTFKLWSHPSDDFPSATLRATFAAVSAAGLFSAATPLFTGPTTALWWWLSHQAASGSATLQEAVLSLEMGSTPGHRLNRSSNATLPFDTAAESFGYSNPHQEFCNFDRVGKTFKAMVVGRNISNSVTATGTLRVRVGGTYGVADGTPVLEQAISITPGAPFVVVGTPVTNIWTGWQPVKMTMQSPTVDFRQVGIHLMAA